MSDPWSGVAPSVVASVATTLITLGATKGVSVIASRNKRNETPIRIRRRAQGQWSIVNETKTVFVQVNMQLVRADGTYVQPGEMFGPDTLFPNEEFYFGPMADGTSGLPYNSDMNGWSMTITWTELGRGGKRKRWSQVEVKVKPDIDEYTPKRELPNMGH